MEPGTYAEGLSFIEILKPLLMVGLPLSLCNFEKQVSPLTMRQKFKQTRKNKRHTFWGFIVLNLDSLK